MKRLRPIEEKRISRLRRLYSFSTDEYIPRKARRWSSYSGDADLAEAQELIEKVVAPIVEGEALEFLVEDLESMEAEGMEEERAESNKFSRRGSDRYFSGIEPADEETAEKFEEVIEKYLSLNYKSSGARRLYNKNENDYSAIMDVLVQNQNNVVKGYGEVFRKLVEKGFLFKDGSFVRKGFWDRFTGKKEPLKDKQGNVVKVLTPPEYRNLLSSILATSEETQQMVKQKLSEKPEVANRYNTVVSVISFVGLVVVVGAIIAYSALAAQYGDRVAQELAGSLAPFFKAIDPVIQTLSDAMKTVVGKIADTKNPVMTMVNIVLAWVSFSASIGVIGAEIERRKLQKLRGCLLELNKITSYVGQKLNTIHGAIREAVQAPNEQVDSSLSVLEQELGEVSQLGSRLQTTLNCLGIEIQ